jgi:hypothetical protein
MLAQAPILSQTWNKAIRKSEGLQASCEGSVGSSTQANDTTDTVQPFQPEPHIPGLTFVNPELAAVKVHLSEIEVSDNSSRFIAP